ncbi:MAG: hypothetical protein VB858_22760, partial [Planctomycetaceae bacterium]
MPAQTKPHTVRTPSVAASRKPAALLGPGIHRKELSDFVTRARSRTDPRFRFERPVEVLPVALDGTLDQSRKFCGTSRDISQAGIQIEVMAGEFHHSQPLLLGLHCEQHGTVYAGLMVRRVERATAGGTLIGASFGGPAADVLSTGTIVPEFDRDLLMFTLP